MSSEPRIHLSSQTGNTWMEEKDHQFLLENRSHTFFKTQSGLKVLEVNSTSREWFVNPEKQETGQKPYLWWSNVLKEHFQRPTSEHKKSSLTMKIRGKVRFILPE